MGLMGMMQRGRERDNLAKEELARKRTFSKVVAGM